MIPLIIRGVISCKYWIGHIVLLVLTHWQGDEWIHPAVNYAAEEKRGADDWKASRWYMGSKWRSMCLGMIIELSETAYVWISDVFSGPEIPRASLACRLEPSLSTISLHPLLEALKLHLVHNYYSALLFIGLTILTLHYQEFIECLRYCPIPLACGDSGTGKTTILHCHWWEHGKQGFSAKPQGRRFSTCCECAGIPLGLDDPTPRQTLTSYW